MTAEGYGVTNASGAVEALAQVSASEIHLVISDMKMPERDGFWLLDQMRREHPQIAVLMLTGYGDTEAAVECLRRGAADYLLKPPKAIDLVRAIERGLARRRIELARRRLSDGGGEPGCRRTSARRPTSCRARCGRWRAATRTP